MLKKIFVYLFIMTLLSTSVSAFSASRSFSKISVSGSETIEVSITTDGSGVSVYGVEEYVPSGWTILNSTVNENGGVAGNKITWLFLDNNNRILKYNVTAPTTSGTYQFSGNYTDGFTYYVISGQNQVTVAGASPQIKINEVESNPSQDNEWIELYNPNSNSVDISGWKLYDGLASPSLLYTFPSGTTIQVGGYIIYDLTTTKLNNANEFITLKDSSNVTIDETPTLADNNANDNKTWQRIPNGIDTDSADDWQFATATKDATNSIENITEDTTSPVITNAQANPGTTSAIISWNTDENADSKVEYGLTTNLGNNESNESLVIYHLISLISLQENTPYYYKVISCDATSNCNESSIATFTTLTSGVEEDDLMVNYVRGKIIIDGNPASQGTPYKVGVLSGLNTGQNYGGIVDDSNIPSSLIGNGYYDTGDKVIFSTGERFKVSLIGYEQYNCSIEGTFENGGNGNFDTQQGLVNIDCDVPNRPPVLIDIGNKQINESQLLQFTISAVDIDGDNLTYSAENLPQGAEFNAETRTFSWTPDYTQAGAYQVGFIVSDGNGGEDSETIIINVTDVNRQPQFSETIPDQNWNEDTSITINLTQYLSDPDDDNLTLDVKGNENITISILEGVANLIPIANWYGSETVIFSASDGKLSADSNAVLLTVLPVNDAPVLEYIDNIIVDENETVLIIANATDVDEDALNYSINDTRFSQEENIFTWQTGYEDEGIYYVLIDVTDGNLTDSQQIRVDILNVNRAPVLEIENITINEDETGEVTINASDPDDDILIYSATRENLSEVDCELEENNLILVPYTNWYGLTSCEVQVSDGYLTDSKTFDITVLPVNDVPILEHINNIIVDEDEVVRIIANATDIDGDILSYEINDSDSRFNQTSLGVFTWQTNYDDVGVYHFLIIVDDGNEGTDDKEVKVEVKDVNEPPYLEPIDDLEIEEDSGFINDIPLTAVDNDGYITRFLVAEENLSEVDCDVSDGVLGIKPAGNFSGNAYCKIRAYDDDNAYDETILNIYVTNVNDEPVIDSFSPDFNPKITENGSQEFSVVWSDIDNTEAEVKVKWYVDGSSVRLGNSFKFETGVYGVGEYEIKVVVNDMQNSTGHNWTIKVTDAPITEKYDGETTDFSGMGEEELANANLILEKSYFGKIEFLDSVDLRDIADLDEYTDIQNGLAGIDTDVFSSLKNKKAKITFYGLNFEKTPTIYYDEKFNLNADEINRVCPSTICSNINYDKANRILTFDVSSFSSFKAGDTLTCSQQSGFVCSEKERCKGNLLEARDTNSCCSIKCVPDFKGIDVCNSENSNIDITIENPDENDDFKINEIIKGKIKLENNFDDKKDFDVDIFFYDFTEDDKIDDVKENVKIGENDDKEIEFDFKVDEDLDEDNEYYIYAKAEDEDNESICNEAYVKIELEREEHDVIIQELKLEPENSVCGKFVNLEIKTKNLGGDDEDVYVSIENEELGIKEKTEEFELEKFDEDDENTQKLSMKIPENASKGEYIIKTAAFFNGKKVVAGQKLSLEECRKEEKIVRILETIKLTGEVRKRVIQKIDEGTIKILLISALSGGIIVISILIGVLLRRK